MMAFPRVPAVLHPAPKERRTPRRLNVERLEPRLLMAADTDPSRGLLTHGGACSCPICSGVGLEQYQPEAAETVASAANLVAAPVATGVPALSSRPGAAATIYLDFNGHTEATWGSYSNVVTKVFDRDGNLSTFSTAEISTIQEIWARVAEDYSPFNINVTTVQPSSFANKAAVRVAIGGNWSDWFGQAAGGVAYVGGFYNNASNVAYVFEDALGNGNAKYVAEAASHEAGHTFGLLHQAVWNGTQKTEEYNPGNSAWAPIMGVGYYSARTTWHNGPTSNAYNQYQDDLAVLSNASNGFGYAADDFGNTIGAASTLAIASSSVNTLGRIGRNDDVDMFRFNTSGGALNLTLNVAQFGANLDSVLQLFNSAGQSVLLANPTASLGASLATTLASGTYYLAVRSTGGYGNLGTYTLSGTIVGGSSGTGVQQTATPEISVEVGGVAVADGGSVAFGSTTTGTPVDRVITIRNTGTGTLSLGNPASLPTGFTIVSPLGSTSLGAGQATTLTVRLTAAAAGSFSGTISIGSNDSNESPYDLTLSGTVTAPTAQSLIRYIDNGASGFTATGQWFNQAGSGRESDFQWALPGTGSTVATWSFSSLTPGQYRVSATWPAGATHATNSPFSVYNGSQLLGMTRVNQKIASAGLSSAGSQWQNLGNFTITGNTLVVKLNNSANNWIVADAIRIERISTAASPTAGGALLAGEASAIATLAAGQSNGLATADDWQALADSAFGDSHEQSWLANVAENSPNLPPAAIPSSLLQRVSRLPAKLTAGQSAASLFDDLAASLADERAGSLAELWD